MLIFHIDAAHKASEWAKDTVNVYEII